MRERLISAPYNTPRMKGVKLVPKEKPETPAPPPAKPQGARKMGALIALIAVAALLAFGYSLISGPKDPCELYPDLQCGPYAKGGDTGNGGSGGTSGCPTICDAAAITVAPQCECPPDSTYYDTITGSTCTGCKQCICKK